MKHSNKHRQRFGVPMSAKWLKRLEQKRALTTSRNENQRTAHHGAVLKPSAKTSS